MLPELHDFYFHLNIKKDSQNRISDYKKFLLS